MQTNTQSSPIRILAVDDHPLLREGIAALIGTQPDMRLVAEAASVSEAIEKFRGTRPDVTLMDIQMPGASGIDAIAAIRTESPDARIIVLTTYAGDALAQRALRAGVQGYLLKGSVRKELLDAIRKVHAGLKRIQPEIAAELASCLGEEGLSVRELEVLALIAAGNANKSIASKLSITEETIKGHVKNILAKLRANDRTHAVTLALRRGMIQL
ncbi:MAG: response regulator transcription factor [Steroidobacteraceae bacterium]